MGSTLRREYDKHGAEALQILEQQTGVAPRLSRENLITLAEVLGKGAEAYGLEGSFWDRKRVKYVIEQEFKCSYSVGHISEILAKINYTLQKPRKKDFRQTEEKVTTWTTETLPEIKKK